MRISAGLLLYRGPTSRLEVLLVHPGGPFWVRKDAGVWSVPKGELDGSEDPHAAAVREFTEELGSPPPTGTGESVAGDLELGVVRQSAAKSVIGFARRADFDPSTMISNEIEIDWPPRSGRTLLIPEVDRADWCTVEQARERLVPGQVALLDRLLALLGTPTG